MQHAAIRSVPPASCRATRQDGGRDTGNILRCPAQPEPAWLASHAQWNTELFPSSSNG